MYLNSQWFVGLNEEGFVTVFQGRPEQVLGWSLRTTQQESDLHVTDLPQSFQEKVQVGIPEQSEADAQERVKVLEGLATDPEFKRPPAKTPVPTPTPTPTRDTAPEETSNNKRDRKGNN